MLFPPDIVYSINQPGHRYPHTGWHYIPVHGWNQKLCWGCGEAICTFEVAPICFQLGTWTSWLGRQNHTSPRFPRKALMLGKFQRPGGPQYSKKKKKKKKKKRERNIDQIYNYPPVYFTCICCKIKQYPHQQNPRSPEWAPHSKNSASTGSDQEEAVKHNSLHKTGRACIRLWHEARYAGFLKPFDLVLSEWLLSKLVWKIKHLEWLVLSTS